MSIAKYTDPCAGLLLCARDPRLAVFATRTRAALSAPAWGLALALLPALARADYALNFPTPASGQAQEIYDLHILILWICFAIFVIVFVPMFVALICHRKSLGRVAAKFHDNLKVEVIWTVIPTLILVGMAWPATNLVMSMKDTSKEDLTIKVTGRQWKWDYEYLGDDIRFTSNTSTPTEQIDGAQAKGANYLLEVDHPLVVPAGKKIRLVLTASDVIHSWWVPAIGVKQDAIPGFIRDTWFSVDNPGTYRGQCTELCGIGHGFMPVVVEVVAPEQFASWKQEQKNLLAAAAVDYSKTYTMDELKTMGAKVYTANCMACHQPNGAGIPNAFPALAGSKMVRGEKSAHIERVFNGKPGTAMAAFGKQLSDLDIAAVITYERNTWSNAMGDVVQPTEVAALHKRSR